MKMKQEKDVLPSLKQLLQGPVTLNCLNGCHRQLRAAGLYDGTEMRLKLSMLAREGDAEEWADIRSKLAPSGKVLCPECEGAGSDEREQMPCSLCSGNGMVSRAVWDEWYFAEKSCKLFGPGCEERCRLRRCNHDLSRSSQQIIVLALEAKKAGGSWKEMGDSLDGYKLVGLAKNRTALERFIYLVAEACNMPVDDGEGE